MGALDVDNPSLARTSSGAAPHSLPAHQRHATSAFSRSFSVTCRREAPHHGELPFGPHANPTGPGSDHAHQAGPDSDQARRQSSEDETDPPGTMTMAKTSHSRTPSGDDHCTVLVLLPDSSVHIFSQPGTIRARDVIASLPPSHRLVQITTSHDVTRGMADETHYCQCSRRTLDENETLRHGETYFSVPSKDALCLLDPVAGLYNGNKDSPRTNAVRAYFPGRGPYADDCVTSAGAATAAAAGAGRSEGGGTCFSVGSNDADGAAILSRLTLQDVGIAASVSGGTTDEASSSSSSSFFPLLPSGHPSGFFPLLPRRSSTEAPRRMSRLSLGLSPRELQSRRISMEGSRSMGRGHNGSKRQHEQCSEVCAEKQAGGSGLPCSCAPRVARQQHTCKPVPRCGSESSPSPFAQQETNTQNCPSSRIAMPRYFQRRFSSEAPRGMPDPIPKSFSSPRPQRRLSVDAAVAWNQAALARTDPTCTGSADAAQRLVAPLHSGGAPLTSCPLRGCHPDLTDAAETRRCRPQQVIGTSIPVAVDQSPAAADAQGAGQVPAQAAMSEWLQDSRGLRTRGGSSKLKARFKDFDLWLTQSDSPPGQGQDPQQERAAVKPEPGQGKKPQVVTESHQAGNIRRGRKSLSEATPVGGITAPGSGPLEWPTQRGGLTRRLSGVFSGSRGSGPKPPSVPLEGVGGSRPGFRGRRRHRLSLQSNSSCLQTEEVQGHEMLDSASGVRKNVVKESTPAKEFQQQRGSKQEALGRNRPLPSIVEKPQPSRGSSLLRTMSLGLLAPKTLVKLQSAR